MKRGINWGVLTYSLIAVYFAAFLGSLFTDTSGWYESVKPSITPPNFVFPIVWNILFFLISLSIYFAWTGTKYHEKNKRIKIFVLYGINLLLNVFWSIIFFYAKLPVFSFFELILLAISTISIMFFVWKISKASYFLLTPYLLWLVFAGVLNYLIAF